MNDANMTAPAGSIAVADKLTPATTLAPSGAMIEPTIVERVDYAHPAIDNNPRAGVAETSNRIELNDPSMSGSDAVAARLGLSNAAPVPKATPKA